MKSLHTFTAIASLIFLSFATALFAGAPELAVMETAFGTRAKVENIELAKKAGYQGIQLHTGDLDESGLLPFSYPSILRQFKEASAEHGVEIVSLCAGTMNRLPCWEPETKEKSLSVAIQSIRACQALDVPILLVPFFGRSAFGDDPSDPRFRAVAELLGKLAVEAEACNVTLGIESRTKQPALDHLLSEINSPYLKVYYDTGNMLDSGENVYEVIESWGPETICEIHLKPFQSEYSLFGEGNTDLPRLRNSLRNSGYQGWYVFEAGPGKKRELGFEFARENRIRMQRMWEDPSN